MKGGIKMPKKIYVWGLDPQIIRDQIAGRAEVIGWTELPDQAPDGLLIVINNQEFNEWAEARTMADESQPRPVLAFEPADPSYDVANWAYIDGWVSPDNWDGLENLLECEHVLEAREMGVDVPVSFLRGLGDRLFREIFIEEVPFGDAKWEPQDAPMRKHLKQCVVCRAALNESVELENAIARKFGLR